MALATAQINLHPVEVFAIDEAMKLKLTGASSRNEFVRQATDLATLALTTDVADPWDWPTFGEAPWSYPYPLPQDAPWFQHVPDQAWQVWRMPPVRIQAHQAFDADAMVQCGFAPSREAFVRKAVRMYLGQTFAERRYGPYRHNLQPPPRPRASSQDPISG